MLTGAVYFNGFVEPKMSFSVQHLAMAVHIIIVMLASSTFAEWMPIASTPLRKVLPDNATRGSTKLFTIPKAFDYSDEFTCANIHNLTMLGYGKPVEFIPDALEEDFLKALETKLKSQIEDRMTNLGYNRGGRTYHIGFPSLEGALVSISLLLFAVYLIKLVMKIMYTFNTKRGTTEYVGFMSNLRQPIVISPNRQKRDLDLELEGFKIRDLIEDRYNFFN